MYPRKKIMAVFQPHLFSRTRDFMNEFANELAKFSEIVLLEIYPAREKPIIGIDSNELLNRINNTEKKLLKKVDLAKHIVKSEVDVVIDKIKNAIIS
jgi:UDP-N-acetylmuramate--alanine ligase